MFLGMVLGICLLRLCLCLTTVMQQASQVSLGININPAMVK